MAASKTTHSAAHGHGKRSNPNHHHVKSGKRKPAKRHGHLRTRKVKP